MKASHTCRPVFDDANLVAITGLIPTLGLADQAGLSDLLAEHLHLANPNAALKAVGVVGGMLAGADTIDGLDLLRHGATGRLFTGIRAPSTYGSFLRAFTFGHVRQLDAVHARLLAGLAARVPGLLPGPQELTFVDVDDTMIQAYGYAKQAVRYGRDRGVKGSNLALATISGAHASPVIAACRLRAGNANAAMGAGTLVVDALTTLARARAGGQVLLRGDSGYYTTKVAHTTLKAGAWFSLTAKQDKAVRAAIGRIEPHAWIPIRYPRAIYDEIVKGWVSDAEVAEVTGFRVFKRRPISCRLVVRRVKRLGPPPGADGASQDPLFTDWRYHAFITNSTLDTVTADAVHRDHAIIEQVHAELKNGPLAHLPSGRYPANAAWAALAVIGFNIARAANHAAGWATARWKTLRQRLINLPARLATSGRRHTLHLPQRWPWAQAFTRLWNTTCGPPTPATP